MGLVDVNSPLSFYIAETTDDTNQWRNNQGDRITEDRKTGNCCIMISTPTSGKFELKYAKTFDKAIDCLRYVKYRDMEKRMENES